MQGSPSIIDQTVSATLGVSCLPLDRASESLKISDAKLKILVLVGSGVVQRFTAGQWIEMRTLFRGGVVVTNASTLIRVKDAATSEGVMLLISSAEAEHHFARITDGLIAASHVYLKCDPVIESLVKVLETSSQGTAPCVEEHVLRAIALRISVLSNREIVEPTSKQCALPSWRLQRVMDFITERLDREVPLADMACAAGLSPMHFAAQFKIATGMRPHHYLIAERMDRAKQLLQKTSDTIMDVALAVGFQSQAHFATVFKRHESMTPRQWRHACTQVVGHAPRTSHRTRGVASQPARTVAKRGSLTLSQPNVLAGS